MLSYWEKETFTSYDYLIIGSGIVGLSAAATLAEKRPKARIALLERSVIPNGASTRNAGFACFGSFSEIWADLQKIGEKDTLLLIESRLKGLQKLRSRFPASKISFQVTGGYDVILQDNPLQEVTSKLQEVNQLLRKIPQTSKPLHFKDKTSEASKLGFKTEAIRHLIFTPIEAQLHPGQLIDQMQCYVQKKGVKIHMGAEVSQLQENTQSTVVLINNTFEVRAQKTIVCTNAFTQKILHNTALTPGRGQVLITTPIENLQLQGNFHFQEGYFYFRNVGDRVLFGGGRHLDFAGETTTEIQTTPAIIDHLVQHLQKWILPGQPFEIANTWAGIMAFNETRKPIIESYSPNIILAAGLNGMGIAIGSHVGDQAAELAMNA